MAHRLIDFQQTHKNLIRVLSTELVPLHYTEAFRRCYVPAAGYYSEKTVPQEKFRQYYAEHPKTDVTLIKGGHLALARWFPQNHQLSCLPPSETVTIEGNTIVSFDAGYDVAKRESTTQNKFQKDHKSWYERRRRGMLVESHIAQYFRSNYPNFFIEPSNKGRYGESASDDFTLRTDWARIVVDVKSVGEDQYNDSFVITEGKSNNSVVVYIVGDFEEDTGRTIIKGMRTSDMAKVLASKITWRTDSYALGTNYLWSIEPLLVMLNMAKLGMNYAEYKRNRKPSAHSNQPVIGMHIQP